MAMLMVSVGSPEDHRGRVHRTRPIQGRLMLMSRMAFFRVITGAGVFGKFASTTDCRVVINAEILGFGCSIVLDLYHDPVTIPLGKCRFREKPIGGFGELQRGLSGFGLGNDFDFL